MNRKQKEELVESLHKTFLNSQSIIVTHIDGLTVSETTNLRSNMTISEGETEKNEIWFKKIIYIYIYIYIYTHII